MPVDDSAKIHLCHLQYLRVSLPWVWAFCQAAPGLLNMKAWSVNIYQTHQLLIPRWHISTRVWVDEQQIYKTAAAIAHHGYSWQRSYSVTTSWNRIKPFTGTWMSALDVPPRKYDFMINDPRWHASANCSSCSAVNRPRLLRFARSRPFISRPRPPSLS